MIKIGDIRRLQSQFEDAVKSYQEGIGLARLAKRADYETEALAHLALSELLMGKTVAAKDHASRSVTLGANCSRRQNIWTKSPVELVVASLRGSGRQF